MDFAESTDHQDLRATVAKVCSGFGDEYFRRVLAEDGRTHELWKALGDSGFLGVNLPEEYGGGGAGIAELAIVVEETAAAGTPLLLLLVSAAISGEVLKGFGTEEQKQQFLPPMAAGDDKMVFAITEPDAGSNSLSLSTTARKDGDDWIVRGTKYYISGVDEASWLLVVARTGEDESGRGRMTLFVIDTDSAGLSKAIIPVEMRAPEKQFTLTFDEVRVPDSRRVGEVGRGMEIVFHGLNPERITGAAIENGIARYALAKAARYANERQVWGVPIGSHQGVSHPLSAAAIDVELARLMTTKAAWLHDQGLPAGEASNMAKFAAADAALDALDAAIQVHGGNGLASEYGLAHLWGMARLLKIAPVSREMVLNYVSTHTLGLPRSY
jgi:alkylation response protein AidB-like acyl-CoA dehydrogenase